MKSLSLRSLGFFLMGSVFLISGCGEEAPLPEIIRPVVTVTIEEPEKFERRTFSGIAQGVLDANLSFRVGGEIERLAVRIGDRVKQGDVIAQLDPTDFEIQLEQSRAMLAQARAALVQADADYTRTKALYENENVSKSALDASQAGYDSARAQVEAAQKQMQQAGQQLAYTVLRAPQDGAVGEVPVEKNQVVQAGQVIATLVSEDDIEMEIGIPEALISEIREGDEAAVTFDVIKDLDLPARVAKVGIDASTTSTYPVKLDLLKSDPRIRPGMVGEATISLVKPESEQFVALPPAAVAGRLDDRYVWVFSAESAGEGVVSRREIELGELTPVGLQVKAGVGTGDIVVVRGVHRLEEGMRVKLLESPLY